MSAKMERTVALRQNPSAAPFSGSGAFGIGECHQSTAGSCPKYHHKFTKIE